MDIPGYEELDRATTGAILAEAGKLASEVFSPINAVGDAEGCRLQDGIVTTPTGFSEAFSALRDGGWSGLDMPEAFGGQGLPILLNIAVSDFFCSANVALTVYQVLTHGAASTILAHGTEVQKALYVPKMISAEWTGTMNLTEPHCGTDLGMLRTSAEPKSDGTYKITGQKIFISAGDHDLSKNIVHLVLARIPGAPAGVKGISLFIVPKLLPDNDGNPGERNAVSVGKLEDKMGLHGNATCVMNYDAATGFLLGTEHKGMRAMFTMMNEARLNTALQGVSLAEAAYQAARDYALDRLQGRSATGPKNPEGPADPIIVHPDIRRSLMEQRSFVEGGRALALWGAELIDRSHRNQDEKAHALVSLLIPVMKGFLTDRGFDMTVLAQQVFGGHGYVEEHGMSQVVRDARIAQIYEGANGIHALDLVARKLPMEGGEALKLFFATVEGFLAAHRGNPDLAEPFVLPLERALGDLKSASEFCAQTLQASPDTALAGSYDYMHLFGHVCLGYMWGRQAEAAHRCLVKGGGDARFLKTKLRLGQFYMVHQLPLTTALLQRVKNQAEPVMAMAAEDF